MGRIEFSSYLWLYIVNIVGEKAGKGGSIQNLTTKKVLCSSEIMYPLPKDIFKIVFM